MGEQSSSSKQARIIDSGNSADKNDYLAYLESCRLSFQTYERLLKAGWPRELARAVLPVSTYSHMFAKVDLHNLLRFLDLRLHEHAQYEIRVYAEAMAVLAETVAPVAIKAWKENR